MAEDHSQIQLILPDGKVNEPSLAEFVKATGISGWGLDYQVSRGRGSRRTTLLVLLQSRLGAGRSLCGLTHARCSLSAQIVAIMGPQSSGKSTLMNHLFNTRFFEMDALSRRGQTTQASDAQSIAHLREFCITRQHRLSTCSAFFLLSSMWGLLSWP